MTLEGLRLLRRSMGAMQRGCGEGEVVPALQRSQQRALPRSPPTAAAGAERSADLTRVGRGVRWLVDRFFASCTGRGRDLSKASTAAKRRLWQRKLRSASSPDALGMTRRQPHVGAPRLLHQLIEGRALLEMATLPWNWPWLARTPRGDGHPVLLLPGFMADEKTLVVLKLFLRNRGYEVQTWGFGRNVGFNLRHAQALEQKIRYMHHKSGRKVSLVGWSLGGMFALHGAHEAPECVRTVITLGSPVSIDRAGSQSAPLVKALYRLVAHPMGTRAHVSHQHAKRLWQPKSLPVPISCLYSLTDGVVPPQEATIDGNRELHENIRVPGSHLGLGFNPLVLWIVADRLAQPEGQWRRFEPPPGLLGRIYRLAVSRRAPAPARPSRVRAAAPAPGTPGSTRARTGRRTPDRASARGTRSARR